jgi:hypothetical protein
MKKYLTPAELVIQSFGPVKAHAAKKLGVSRQNLENWLKPRKLTEPGTIPAAKHKEVLAKAKEFNISITAEELIYGRAVVE